MHGIRLAAHPPFLRIPASYSSFFPSQRRQPPHEVHPGQEQPFFLRSRTMPKRPFTLPTPERNQMIIELRSMTLPALFTKDQLRSQVPLKTFLNVGAWYVGSSMTKGENPRSAYPCRKNTLPYLAHMTSDQGYLTKQTRCVKSKDGKTVLIAVDIPMLCSFIL